MNKHDWLLVENAVAISAQFHTDRRYQEFYDAMAEKLSGFPGIYRFIGELAEALTKQEAKIEEGYWPETVDAVAEIAIDAGCLGPHYLPEPKKIIAQALSEVAKKWNT